MFLDELAPVGSLVAGANDHGRTGVMAPLALIMQPGAVATATDCEQQVGEKRVPTRTQRLGE
jgi:hypothetical protein